MSLTEFVRIDVEQEHNLAKRSLHIPHHHRTVQYRVVLYRTILKSSDNYTRRTLSPNSRDNLGKHRSGVFSGNKAMPRGSARTGRRVRYGVYGTVPYGTIRKRYGMVRCGTVWHVTLRQRYGAVKKNVVNWYGYGTLLDGKV